MTPSPEKLKSSPQTFGDLYTQIQSENILTPEQEDALRERAIKKYGMMGLLAKRQEAIGVNTRNELSSLLSGLPEKDQILAKLDTLLPGSENKSEKLINTVKQVEEVKGKKPDNGTDISASLESNVPAVAATVAGLGTAVVGTGLVSEKGWKKMVAEGFTHFKDWVGGLFGEDSMLGGMFGGLKDMIMGLLGKIGVKLGIKTKEESTTQPTENENKERIAAIAGNGVVAQLLVKFSPAREKYTSSDNKKGFEGAPSAISDPGFLEKTPSELFLLTKKYPSLDKSSGIEKEFGTNDIQKHGSSVIWHAVMALASEEGFLSKYTKDENWKNKKLSVLFPSFGNELEIVSGFQNIKSKEDLIKYFESDIFGGENGTSISQNISSRIEKLKSTYSGLDITLATELFVNRPINTQQAKIGKNDQQIEFLDKLETYKKNFSTAFIANKSLNLGASGYESFFTGENELRPNEALKLFIITGGKTNFTEFSTTEKLLYYKTLISLLRDNRRDTNKASYTVVGELVGLMASTDTSIIPEDVKKLLSNVLGGVVKGFFNEAFDAVSGTFSSLSPANKALVTTTAAAILWILPQLRIAKVGITALVVGLGIGGLTFAQASQKSDAELQKLVEEYKTKGSDKK